MEKYSLFTDGSLNPKLKFGIGAYLFLQTEELDKEVDTDYVKSFSKEIVYKEFSDTSSTNLEIRTVLFALSEMKKFSFADDNLQLKLFTDSQCVHGLPRRRKMLEENNFQSKTTNLLLNNSELYKVFFNYYDQYNFELIKVIGHLPSKSRNTIQKFFSLIDRGVRNQLEVRLKNKFILPE